MRAEVLLLQKVSSSKNNSRQSTAMHVGSNCGDEIESAGQQQQQQVGYFLYLYTLYK